MKRFVLTIDVLIRLAVAAFVLADPFWGVIVFLVYDFFDSFLLRKYAGFSRRIYLIKDLKLDLIIYLPMLLVSIDYGVTLTLFLLLFFRYLGVYLFAKNNNEKFLIYFPNFYEAMFVVLISLKSRGFLPSSTSVGYVVILFSSLVLQMGRELLMHQYIPQEIKNKKSNKLLGYLGYTG